MIRRQLGTRSPSKGSSASKRWARNSIRTSITRSSAWRPPAPRRHRDRRDCSPATCFTTACCGRRWFAWPAQPDAKPASSASRENILTRPAASNFERRNTWHRARSSRLLRVSRRRAGRLRRSDQVRLPQSGAEMASGPQSGQQSRSRRKFPPGLGSLQRPLRCTKALDLRPLRRMPDWAAAALIHRLQFVPSSKNFRTSSAIFSASRTFSAARAPRRQAWRARPARRRSALRHVADLRRSRRRRQHPDSHIPRDESCESCKGTGAKPGSGMSPARPAAAAAKCPTQQGFFSITRTCPACQGAGQVIRDACVSCRGQGRIERERTLEVGIPAGVDSGTRLRMAGQGEPGTNGGAAGDLYIFLEVKEHRFFRTPRRGLVSARFRSAFTQAALGAKIKIPTLKGEEDLEIPEGTQSGQIFRKKGKGPAQPARRQRRSLRQRSRGDPSESLARTAQAARAAGPIPESRKQARRAQFQLLRQSERHLRLESPNGTESCAWRSSLRVLCISRFSP